MNRYLFPFFFAVPAFYAQAADPMAAACAHLLKSLEIEVEALEQMRTQQDVDANLADLRAALQMQRDMPAVDEKELWRYVENTPGVKQPLVDALSSLALEFARLESAAFFHHAALRELLAPQTEETLEVQKAKLEKIHAVDYDED